MVMSEHAMKPIWYFVGLILSIMGALIMVSGIYHLINPPEVKDGIIGTSPRHLVGRVDDPFWRNDVSENKKVMIVNA